MPIPLINFRSERNHFPPNLQKLAVKHLLFALITEQSESIIEASILRSYKPDGSNLTKSLLTTPLLEGRISTRLASGNAWRSAIGDDISAIGTWQFTLPQVVIDGIVDGTIQNILIIETFSGIRPVWN